jgi:hypothetical protein
MNVQGDLWGDVSFVDRLESVSGRYGVETPAQKQRTRRIKYGVPGIHLYYFVRAFYN